MHPMSDSQVSAAPRYVQNGARTNADSRGLETSAYEAARYDATLATLPRTRYRMGLEIGCSIGGLTQRLGQRCNRLLAVDVDPEALDRARRRCRDLPQVRFTALGALGELPDDRFDLIVISDVAPGWSTSVLARLRHTLVERMLAGGHLLLVHGTPWMLDSSQTSLFHDALVEDAGPSGPLCHLTSRREAAYRLDLFERRSPALRTS